MDNSQQAVNLSQLRNRAGNNSTPSRPASAVAVFFRTPAAISKAPPAIRFPLPRIGKPLPATSLPMPRLGQFCSQFESVRRVFERLCLQFFRLCPQFTRSCREFASACRDLQSSAAEQFIRNCHKKAQNAQAKPSPVLSDTLAHRMGEGWGVGLFNFQPSTFNYQLT